MYIDYTLQYQRILDIFAKHQKSKKLQKYLKLKRKQRKPLTNHLILPIQRIPRYMLLLQDLKKRTPPTHKHFSDIDAALNTIENVANQINEKKREIENMSQCLQIQENLGELNKNIVEPHRKFLKQFVFIKCDNDRPRQFFVFSDLIIITNLKWRVKSLVNMRTTELKSKQKQLIEKLTDGQNNNKLNIHRQKSIEKPLNENEFILYTTSGKPIKYKTDSDKINEIEEFDSIIIDSRFNMWDADLSHLEHGKSDTRKTLRKQGVSQSTQYRNQLEHLKRMKIKQDLSTLNAFKKTTKTKKSKVLDMLGADQ